MEIRSRLRGLLRELWFYALACVVSFVSVLAAVLIARAVGGVPGIVLGVIVCLVLMFVLSLFTLIVSAGRTARRERIDRDNAPRGE